MLRIRRRRQRLFAPDLQFLQPGRISRELSRQLSASCNQELSRPSSVSLFLASHYAAEVEVDRYETPELLLFLIISTEHHEDGS